MARESIITGHAHPNSSIDNRLGEILEKGYTGKPVDFGLGIRVTSRNNEDWHHPHLGIYWVFGWFPLPYIKSVPTHEYHVEKLVP